MAGKLNLAVSALRWGEEIHATVQAVLPDGHLAEVTDIYPGGRILYANDPGEAQIFVRIRRPGEAEAVTGGRWEESREIPHCRPHQDLAVIAEFEGRTFIARTPIHRFRARSGGANLAAVRRTLGLPPTRSVDLTPAMKQARSNPPVRSSNCPAPPLAAAGRGIGEACLTTPPRDA